MNAVVSSHNAFSKLEAAVGVGCELTIAPSGVRGPAHARVELLFVEHVHDLVPAAADLADLFLLHIGRYGVNTAMSTRVQHFIRSKTISTC